MEINQSTYWFIFRVSKTELFIILLGKKSVKNKKILNSYAKKVEMKLAYYSFKLNIEP